MKHISLENRWSKALYAVMTCVILLYILGGCVKKENESVSQTTQPVTETSEIGNLLSQQEPSASTDGQQEIIPMEPKQSEETSMQMKINDTPVVVTWEDNDSVAVLDELVQEAPLTIQMSMYGGFEQVGSIGTSLPRNDIQTTTEAGDIVLYSGDQIVVFYGSNSWAYTRLGRITDKNEDELAKMLGKEDVTISFGIFTI